MGTFDKHVDLGDSPERKQIAWTILAVWIWNVTQNLHVLETTLIILIQVGLRLETLENILLKLWILKLQPAK